MSDAGAPLFLTLDQVLRFHDQQIQKFGGAAEVLDAGLLESALAQPQTTWCYDATADLFDLAAAYVFHLAKITPSAMATSGWRCMRDWPSSTSTGCR